MAIPRKGFLPFPHGRKHFDSSDPNFLRRMTAYALHPDAPHQAIVELCQLIAHSIFPKRDEGNK
jgi:hypothetical protein